MTIEESNKLLFDWVYSAVTSEYENFDALIGFSSQNYKEVAKDFFSLFPSQWIMEEKENCTIFKNSQEKVMLTNKKNFEKMNNKGPRILTW